MSDGSTAIGHVFIACSMDGFIARPEGDIRWLVDLPVPEGEDFGYAAFMSGIGAMLMGRASYLKVLETNGAGGWPYPVPVTVLSRTMTAADVPEALKGRVAITAETPRGALSRMAGEGAARVYVDGGQVVQSCLRDGLIAQMTVTRIPVLLGAGLPLFGRTGRDIALVHVRTESWENGFVQSVYDVS